MFSPILYSRRFHSMNNINLENLFIIDLFNLEPKDVESLTFKRGENGESIFSIKLERNDIPCPGCGCSHPMIKGFYPKRITHSVLSDRRCILNYSARRYKCPVCGRTYYEHNPFVFNSMKISSKVVFNVLDQLKDFNETFSSVARNNFISPTSVCSIFDSHVQLSRQKLPPALCLDEVYAFRSPESKYVCVLLDFITQEPVDILPERKYAYLASYFGSVSLEERNNVKLVCSDMYETYRSITKNYFPSAKHSVDPFHIFQEFHRKMNNVRINIMKGYSKKETDEESDVYYLLKHFNWILFKDNDAMDKDGLIFDPNRTKKYNMHFKVYLNLYDIRLKLLALNTKLTDAYDLKLLLQDFYRKSTLENAEKNINELIQLFLMSSIEEMNAFGHTLIRWKEEIINSFTIVKYDYKINGDDGTVAVHCRKINNAIIENRNKVIKCIKHNANGYTNWFRFRNRILYVLRPKATYSLEPKEIPWKKKKDG